MEDNSKSKERLLVIGGGAAGFFCAVNAARLNPSLEVTLVEKTNKLLSKVLVSGGGRCNVTHACFDISEMSKRYPRGSNFVKKTFHQFFTTQTLGWFRDRGVELKSEADGRVFPVTDSSQTIVNCLLKEAEKYRVRVITNCTVLSVTAKEKFFEVRTNLNTLPAKSICISSGGYPKSSMFSWITELGHNIEEPVPSLFTFNMPGNPITKLMGISVDDAQVKINDSKLKERGPLLITHWGMSGPAVLKLSAWGARELKETDWQFSIKVNWLPDLNEHDLRKMITEFRFTLASQRTGNKNPFRLPGRLWDFLLERTSIDPTSRWADLSAKDLNILIENLNAFHCEVKGKTTYKEEFVTSGGIRLNEIDPNTMMSKKVPRLYFAGEVMDVDGITGGYNFQHAWTSGFIAAKSIAGIPE